MATRISAPGMIEYGRFLYGALSRLRHPIYSAALREFQHSSSLVKIMTERFAGMLGPIRDPFHEHVDRPIIVNHLPLHQNN